MSNSRLFFALWPDDGWRRRAVALQAQLPAECRVMPAENLHITLAFLGEVDAARLAELKAIAAHHTTTPFDVQFDRIVHWRGGVAALRYGRIWCTGRI